MTEIIQSLLTGRNAGGAIVMEALSLRWMIWTARILANFTTSITGSDKQSKKPGEIMDDYLYDRQRIDPKREYSSDGMRNVEIVALRVLEQSPFADVTRTRDVIQLDIADEEGITVLVTREAIELRLPTIEWTNDHHGPARTSWLWKRLKTEGLDDIKLAYW
jgi:hypothetical protein